MAEVVAVFVCDWHKYVRASIKKREGDDLYCVWAIDYGVPMVVHASNIVKLPNAFNGMHLNKQRTKLVHTGGMENCLPAEKQFNIAKESSDKQKLLNWTPQAIDLVQKILNQAIKLEFEHVQDLSPFKRQHYFGRLMMQRPSDGEMINVMKSLLEMNMAVLADQEFKNELTSIESLSQPIMFSVNNELLDVKMCVVPVKTVSKTDNGYSNSDIFESESENESLIDENGGDLPIEDNEFFDDSASVMQPKSRHETIVDDALAPVPENPKESNADRNSSSACQENSKINDSKSKSDNDVQNNNTTQKQQPKNANKNRDRKKRNKVSPNVSSQNEQSQNGQQQQQQQPDQQRPKQQQQQQPKQQEHQSQQPQNHHHHQQLQQQHHHRQSMAFDQSGPQPRASNGEQKQNHSTFQHSLHAKPFTHPPAQNHYQAQVMRNSPDARFSGCTEFEAIFGKPPPSRFVPPPPFIRPFPPPSLLGPIPPQRPYPINFNGMYGPPQPESGQSHSPRQSNMRKSFHDNPSKQTMHLMSVLNIQSPANHPNPNNSANQRGQNRMRNRNSGYQGRNNQSANNAGKMNGNANNEQRDKDVVKPTVKNSPAPSKVNAEKSEKCQTPDERKE